MADNAPMQRVWIPGEDKPAWFPADMPQADIEKAVRSHLGIKTEPITEAQPDPTMEMAGRVLNPGQPAPLTTAQKIGNVVLPPLVTAPAIAAGGELLPAAPAIGRALTSGALGGIKAATSGKTASGIAWDAVVDALLGGATEVAGKIAGAVKIPRLGWTTSLGEKATKVARTEAGRAGGGKMLDAAEALIAQRIPKGATFQIPALDPKKALTLDEAVAALKKTDDPVYTMAKDQLSSALNQAESGMAKAGVRVPGGPPVVKPYAGSVFRKNAPTERFTYKPTPTEKGLSATVPAMPGVMAGAQSEATSEPIPGVPAGVIPLMSIPGFGELARHIRPTL